MWSAALRAALVVAVAGAVQLNPDFLGEWRGLPDVSIVGPWAEDYVFQIRESPDGTGWLMTDGTNASDPILPGTVQRFYINNSSKYLTYCGAEVNFFSTAPGWNASVTTFMAPQQATWSTKTMHWCDTATGGCDSVQWKMTLIDADTMVSNVTSGVGVNHFHVTMKRARGRSLAMELPEATAPVQHACTYAPFPSDDDLMSAGQSVSQPRRGNYCPYLKKWFGDSDAEEEPDQKATVADDPAPSSARGHEAYQYCYVLNEALGVTLQWNYDSDAQSVQAKLSVSGVTTWNWISLGVQSGTAFPYMKGSDFVLAYFAHNGEVRVPCAVMWAFGCFELWHYCFADFQVCWFLPA